MSEKTKYFFGDVSPEDFQGDLPFRLTVEEMLIGSDYTMRFRMPPVGGMGYISDYPIQVADIRRLDGGFWLEIVHTDPRSRDWSSSPVRMPVSESGLIEVDNSGQDKIEEWDEGTVTMGYFLSDQRET